MRAASHKFSWFAIPSPKQTSYWRGSEGGKMPTLDTDFKGKVDFFNNKEIILSVTPKTFITVLSNEVKIYLILSHEIDWSLLDKVDKIIFCGVITEKEDPVEKVISPFLVKPRKLRKALLFKTWGVEGRLKNGV